MKKEINKMPKVELHLHLDGSVSIKTLMKLSGLSKEEVIEKVVSKHHKNLGEYLKCFDFVDNLLQTKKALTMASRDLGKRLEKENVIYAEIRFAPISHIALGLSLEEVVEAVLDGLKKCKVKTNLILCLRRGWSIKNNMEIIHLANKFLGKGVVAVDLVGNEDDYPFDEYEQLFRICKHAKIPVTIHAGETTKRDIKTVLYYTKRIGHGIKIVDDEDLINETIRNNVLLEICPNSNIDTRNISDYSSHPIKRLYDKGVKVCINTDNMTVSDIDLNKEYFNLYKTFNFTIDDFKKMNLNAIDGAFISEKEKKMLEKKIIDYNY